MTMKLVTNPFSYKQAGDSLDNPYLKNFPVRLNFRVDRQMQEIFVYASDVEGIEVHKYNLVDQGDGLWSYFALAGQDAFSSEVWENPHNYEDGVIFYLSFYLKESNVIYIIGKKKLAVREIPFWAVVLGRDLQAYVSPYCVVQGTMDLDIEFFPWWKNESGVRQFGGANTVEVLDTPGAPGSGYISPIAETAPGNLTSIMLTDRRGVGKKIANYHEYPNWSDASNFFYYLTFRFRAKAGDTYYVDLPVIIFLIGDCGNKGHDVSSAWAGENSDSVGGLPPLEITSTTTTEPPPTCSSTTKINTGNPVNVYAETITVNIYDSAVGGNLIASGTPSVTGENQLTIARTDIGGDTNQPVSGHYEIKETGPDRTSTRMEAITYGCSKTPVTITEITYVPTETQTEITTTGRNLIPTGTYQAKLYENKYDTEPVETIPAVYKDEHTLVMSLQDDKEGFWEVVEDGIAISSKEEFEVEFWILLDSVEYDQSDARGEVTSTENSREFDPASTYKINYYANEGDEIPTNIYDGTYESGHLIFFPLTENKDGWWEVEENGVVIQEAYEYSDIDNVMCAAEGRPGSCSVSVNCCGNCGVLSLSGSLSWGKCEWWKYFSNSCGVYWIGDVTNKWSFTKIVGASSAQYRKAGGPNGTYDYYSGNKAYCGGADTIEVMGAQDG